MKNLIALAIRAAVLLTVIVLVTTVGYFLYGGQGARGLSDALVYVSFFVLAVGTILGISRFGYKRPLLKPGEPPDDAVPGMVHRLFEAGPFGVALTVAGILCFFAAIAVDLLF